jgi:dihydrolipoamide dehydrogenase
MKRYDVVVIGAGDAGLSIAFKAVSEGLKVALIDKGKVGGTCVNYGCVPSKTLIHVADRILEIRKASSFGIHTNMINADFKTIMERMRSVVRSGRESITKAIEETENLDFYNTECYFINDRSIGLADEVIRGRKIFIASGSRPQILPVQGLDTIQYLTNENVLQLEKLPESMIIIGGGYVGLEYAHFFSALSTKITIVERNNKLLHFEEPEISELLLSEIGKRVELHMGIEIREVSQARGDRSYRVLVKDLGTAEETVLSAETLMIATGRKSNTDLLKIEHAGIETEGANFIKVDDHLQTNKKHVWAVGDAIGRAMFTHAGDKEAEIAWHNAGHRKKMKMDFQSVPHAVFTYPQIASVGLTEEQARKRYDILVGKAKYDDTVMGEAMMEREGFAKAIVEKNTRRILGFHIIGPHAAILLQEVVNAVINKSNVDSLTMCMHTFPALSGLIPETLKNLH